MGAYKSQPIRAGKTAQVIKRAKNKAGNTGLQAGMAALVPAWISPNMLTVLRLGMACSILLVDVFAASLWWVFALGFFAGMTDFLDGAVARQRDQITQLGSYLDPLCDKVLGAVVGFILWRRGLLPTLPLVLVMAAESHALLLPLLHVIRRWAQGRSIKPLPRAQANVWGKWKFGSLAWGMAFLMLGDLLAWPFGAGLGLFGVWLAVALGWMAFVRYIYDWIKGQWN